MSRYEGLIEHPTPAPYPFGPPDVASVLDAGLAEHPDRLALIDGDRTWTWAELDDAVARTASGIAPGEQIWFALGNCAETVIGVLATFRAGAIAVFATGEAPARRRRDLITRIGPTTIVDAEWDFARRATSSPRRSRLGVDAEAPAAIAFTSGTSGRPKAVVHSQRNLLLPGLVSIDVEPPLAGERIGTQLSLQNMNIVALGPLSALLRGSTFVVIPSTKPPTDGLLATIAAHRVNRLFAVPTQLHDVLTHAPTTTALDSVDRIILGGSGGDPSLQRAFLDAFGVRPTFSYGLTEAPTGVVRESFDDPIGIGRGHPLPHVCVTIRDRDTGVVLDPLEEGEVCLEAATEGRWAHTWTPTLGYLGDPDMTSTLYRGGVLHTRDRGHLDSDGALTVTGRLTDVIVRGGQNIDPITLEAALMSTPGSAAVFEEVVVVACPDERLGERVGLLIVPNESSDADSLDITEIVMQVADDVGVPIDATKLVDELPRNPMGKLIRRVDADQFGPENRR